jgi:hypothetical protein
MKPEMQNQTMEYVSSCKDLAMSNMRKLAL